MMLEMKDNPMDVAKEYFPDYQDWLMEKIIWVGTGYPYFWSNKKTQEENFRSDLKYMSDMDYYTLLAYLSDFNCYRRAS